ncbi:OLC1v1014435C1 [Oldenlandia corymbosa var. corymbosa]|uniref:OLC1v1014435C1 n=1 Tax=Oldenlandia corymbosa var. corymbosa TaxID=529605 RepID=A0AAV1E0P3_OLDCO|nr:OLC1v1014435C1 [Oldenlandia corymbosa var. corymbosa]
MATIFYYYLFTLLSSSFSLVTAKSTDPVPAPWPEQFHSVLFMNNSKGALQKVDLWYDWPNGRNFNIIQNQLGKLLYDLEWDNGTSYIYTLDSDQECKVLHFPVGILRPNWLDGATYLGRKTVDGFRCNLWEKVDFIWYYEDVFTKRPVYWEFFTGMIAHVITFEVGSVLEDPNWQAPEYCFKKKSDDIEPTLDQFSDSVTPGDLMRGFNFIRA